MSYDSYTELKFDEDKLRNESPRKWENLPLIDNPNNSYHPELVPLSSSRSEIEYKTEFYDVDKMSSGEFTFFGLKEAFITGFSYADFYLCLLLLRLFIPDK